MAFNLTKFAQSVVGRTLDEDGVFPGECHDLWLAYLYARGGTPGDGHAPGIGYTDQVWRQFPNHRPGLGKLFTKKRIGRTWGTIRRGDVVFWSSYAGVGGLPHVAIAVEDSKPGHGTVLTLTQNPGPVQRLRLTRAGILGVLRPKATPTVVKPVLGDFKPKSGRQKLDGTRRSIRVRSWGGWRRSNLAHKAGKHRVIAFVTVVGSPGVQVALGLAADSIRGGKVKRRRVQAKATPTVIPASGRLRKRISGTVTLQAGQRARIVGQALGGSATVQEVEWSIR